MDYDTFHVQIKKLHQKQSWSLGRISREFGISKPLAKKIVNGHKLKDKALLTRLQLTRPWRHLDELTPAQVKYIFEHRETMP